jgi:hypothetical protein
MVEKRRKVRPPTLPKNATLKGPLLASHKRLCRVILKARLILFLLFRILFWRLGVNKKVSGIHVRLTRSLFGGGILRRLLRRVSLAKPTSAPLRF